MATRAQQVVICSGIQDKCSRIVRIAKFYQAATASLDGDNPDGVVTITGAQQAQLAALFDSLVASVKTDAGTL